MNRDKKISVGALWLGRAFAGILLAVTAQAWASVTATLTAPVEGSIYTPLADITLTADAGAGQGFTLSKVEFFSGTNLIGTDFSAPYSITWSGASLGQHSLTAKATAVKKNNPDQTATSVAVNITVKAQLAFIHTDHLNTPRLVADATGTTVWRWDQAEPFGSNPADDDPDANTVAFDLPLRLPGQRYDKETGLHYNYFRDYDPSLGRYGESDPIGLDGGLNTYAYVEGSPLAFVDLKGLYKYSDPSVPRVTNPDMHNFLICLDQCTGKEQEVTSTTDGKHKDPGHTLGTSVDIGPRGTPSRQLFCCSGRCGATYVLDERKHKTTYQTGPHYHIQLRPPSDRSKDAIPPECKPICL